jgi:hypothetical protein
MSEREPPLRARLHWYRLSVAEFALLTAMCEHCSDGSTIWASIPRLAAYSKLSERKVQRLICHLCGRGILSQLAPANTARHRPVTYRINEPAFQDDPRMAAYRTCQKQLPGIPHTPVPGEPIPDRHLVSSGHQSGVQQTPDSKAFDSRTTDSKPEIHHGDAALNSMSAWLAFKEQLRTWLSDEEWNLWVRPMFLLKTMPAKADQKHLLAAIPPSGRIQAAAVKRLPMMRELLAPAGLNISLTRYPDEWEIHEAKERYDIDMAPKSWTRAS